MPPNSLIDDRSVDNENVDNMARTRQVFACTTPSVQECVNSRGRLGCALQAGLTPAAFAPWRRGPLPCVHRQLVFVLAPRGLDQDVRELRSVKSGVPVSAARLRIRLPFM